MSSAPDAQECSNFLEGVGASWCVHFRHPRPRRVATVTVLEPVVRSASRILDLNTAGGSKLCSDKELRKRFSVSASVQKTLNSKSRPSPQKHYVQNELGYGRDTGRELSCNLAQGRCVLVGASNIHGCVNRWLATFTNVGTQSGSHVNRFDLKNSRTRRGQGDHVRPCHTHAFLSDAKLVCFDFVAKSMLLPDHSSNVAT